MSDIHPVSLNSPQGGSYDVVEGLAADDRKTIAHLIKSGIGVNTLRATKSDLSYIEAWHLACEGEALPWPPTPQMVMRFIAHHLWDPDEKALDPTHGMPEHVKEFLTQNGYLRKEGPHAPATVERRIATWRSLCKWKSLEHPFSRDDVRQTLRSAVRASNTPRRRKSKKNVDLALMEELLDHLDRQCELPWGFNREDQSMKLRAYRDRAILAVMFASGGRRRSEISNMMFGQLLSLPPIEVQDEAWPDGLPSMGIRVGRSKTTAVRDNITVFLTGRSVEALHSWLALAEIEAGPVFLRIGRWGQVFDYSVSPHSVNHILKSRLTEIGLEAADYSAHGVRAGYISSALKAGIPAPEIMEQTLHRSLDILLGYFKDEEQRQGRAAKLL